MNDTLKLIVFSFDKHYYALPLHAIIKVLRAVEVTPVPKTSNLILGVVNVHGEIIPVMDIRQLLGLREKNIGHRDHFIVTHIFSRTLMIVVDSILSIVEYFSNEMEPADCILPKNSKHVKGILKKDNNLILILDIEKLLSPDNFQEIMKSSVKGDKTI